MATATCKLYQTHWPAMEPDKTPIADSMAALLKLKDQGKIRAIGVSNVSLDELKENCRSAPVASDQCRYSMRFRDPEKDILPYCAQHNIATLIFFAGGRNVQQVTANARAGELSLPPAASANSPAARGRGQ